MKESYVEALGTLAWSLVDELAAFLLNFGKSVGYAVLDGKCDVLDAAEAAVVGDKLADRALGSCALKKLDLCLTDAEECCTHPVSYTHLRAHETSV